MTPDREAVFACDVVLNTPRSHMDLDLFAALDLLEDPDDPPAHSRRQMAVVFAIWLRDELSEEAVRQLRAKHA